MKIYLSTIVGVIVGIVLVTSSILISTKNYAIFLSLSSVFVVFGGSIAALLISYNFKNIILMFKAFASTFVSLKEGSEKISNDIKMLVKWAEEVQRNGLAVLDSKMDAVKRTDKFKYYALTLMSANYSSEELHYLFQNFIESKYQRDNIPVNMLNMMAGSAPAFGMVGTLIGLIVMLDGMGSDPTKLGGGLAVALNTTFYGVLAANLFFKPAAAKIKIRNQLKRDRWLLLAEGFVLLRNKVAPIAIQDRLNSFVEVRDQYDMLSGNQNDDDDD